MSKEAYRTAREYHDGKFSTQPASTFETPGHGRDHWALTKDATPKDWSKGISGLERDHPLGLGNVGRAWLDRENDGFTPEEMTGEMAAKLFGSELKWDVLTGKQNHDKIQTSQRWSLTKPQLEEAYRKQGITPADLHSPHEL